MHPHNYNPSVALVELELCIELAHNSKKLAVSTGKKTKHLTRVHWKFKVKEI